MIVTEQMLETAKTINGGYSKAQVEYATELVGDSKWKRNLIEKHISEEEWGKFVELRLEVKSKFFKSKKRKIINALPTDHDDFWKPQPQDIPKLKSKNYKDRGIRAYKRNQLRNVKHSEFYNSREWQSLRVKVLNKYKCKCMMCGRTPQDHEVSIHPEHIKSRIKYPELQLDINNIQLLCNDCKNGKGSKYEKDWRPHILEES